MEGVSPSVVKDELNTNAAGREQLEAQLAATEEPPPFLHPEMARIYRAKVTRTREGAPRAGQPVGGHRGPARARRRHCAHPRPRRRDASDRAAGQPFGDAGSDRTNEEVAEIRRPLPARVFGCGGAQPAVLAAVERSGIARLTHYRERIRRLKADGDTGFPLKSNSPDSRASIVSTRPAAFRRFQLSSIIPCSELTERLFEV
jgi:hypothetical protein